MTTVNERGREVYTGDGTVTVFPVRIFYTALDNIEAILFAADGTRTDLVLNTDYTLTDADAADPDLGGTLTMLTAPPTGTTLVIQLNIALRQETDLPLGGRFPSTAVEDALDEVIQIARQTNTRLDRTLSLPESTQVTTPPTVPDPVTGRALVWAADGNLDNSTVAPDELVGEAQAAATAAQASATAAATSETNAAQSVTDAAAQVTLAETARTGAETAETGAEAARDAAVAAVGTVRVSSDDTTPGVLDGKLVAGSNISFTVGNPAGDETLTINGTAAGATNLDQLTDVDTTGRANNGLLVYDSTDSRYEHRTPAQVAATMSGFVTARVNYNQVTNAIRGSANLSSMVDNGVGDFTFNYTNNHADAGYALVFGSDHDPGISLPVTYIHSTVAPSVSSYRSQTFSNGGVAIDNEFSTSIVVGDLA